MIVREKIQFGVFRAVQIVGFPLVIVAYVLFVLKMIGFSRRTGVSASILASFYPRWMMHQLGTRQDDPCVRLMRVLPNVSQLGLRLLTGPTLLAHRLTGHVPKIYRYPYPGVPSMKDQPAARTTFFDEALARHLADVDQLVILGAGLDTRSYRLPAGSSVRCFEVDTPWTQPFKRAMLKKAGIDTARVTFVPADFAREDWFAKIVAAGFDPSKPTFFLWEAVTMYLDREAVENTLRKVAGTVPGSAVAFDYFSREQLGDQSAIWRYGRAVLKSVGEPMGTFSIDSTPPVRDRVAELLEACGLSLEEQHNFGQETAREHARAGFATATV